MTQNQVLSNLLESLKENPCQGPSTGLDGRCHQINCKKCQQVNQINFLLASNPTVSLKDRLSQAGVGIKSKLQGAFTWFNSKRKRTTEEVIVELKKLGIHKG